MTDGQTQKTSELCTGLYHKEFWTQFHCWMKNATAKMTVKLIPIMESPFQCIYLQLHVRIKVVVS